ncbi:hypothetical protein ALI22I_33420 [Saccharothrix sp. ALI-22-I]|uniref:hypothetical protein n=1 Tax=Saccharothrix sp. ALI-22-I TaxID=1933778 RepID=UPI00097C272B|nr:hypothetical protein [Saccharothrix sp. ALI-22-I]ONI83416.1 hypothetical protein ALI22I_33420 [Saccharothrix sp. ALI-22-I]
MTYLKNQVVASAQALFVICRYLAEHRDGESLDLLVKELVPPANSEVGRGSRTADVPTMLTDSLSIGVDLGILDAQGSGARRLWSLRGEYVAPVKAVPTTDSRGFRNLLLRLFGARALASVAEGERPPDVPFALVWLMTKDPLSTFPQVWDEELQRTFDQAGMRSAVYNEEQWRPFIRWARALGLITMVSAGNKPRVLIDPTKAVEGVLDELPQQSSAVEWLKHLHTAVPLLGDPRLLESLPAGQQAETTPLAATVLAMFKLERAGRLRLISSDDAADTVALRLGDRVRRIAQVHTVKESA